MTDYEKLKGIIDEIDDLLNHHVRSSAPDFKSWYTKAERFLMRIYGEKSHEHKKFLDTSFTPIVFTSKSEAENTRLAINRCSDGLRSCKAVFGVYLEEMIEEQHAVSKTSTSQRSLDMGKVFIVHGHDVALQQSVARIIEKQGLEAIILSEQANCGRTIIEKFENYADVGGAICLFTSDDLGKAKKDADDKPRARQNVVLETGYFMGKLGRDHVVLLADDGVEMPSDLSGVVYTNTDDWKIELLKELRAMGYTVDFNKLP